MQISRLKVCWIEKYTLWSKLLIIPFDLDGRGLVCFLGVPQQHQRYLLLIVANLYISVVIKKHMKKSRFHKNYFFFIFWWASNQNWYEICEFVKICYYWVNNLWGTFVCLGLICISSTFLPAPEPPASNRISKSEESKNC